MQCGTIRGVKSQQLESTQRQGKNVSNKALRGHRRCWGAIQAHQAHTLQMVSGIFWVRLQLFLEYLYA